MLLDESDSELLGRGEAGVVILAAGWGGDILDA